MLSPTNFDGFDGNIPWNSWKQSFTVFTVYKFRWFILGVVSLLNFTNGVVSSQFKTLVNETNSYFCPESGSYCNIELLLELIVIIGFIISAYPAVWICSKLKIRYSLFVAITFLLLTSILKVVASWNGLSSTFRFILLILGQSLCTPSHVIGLSLVPLVSHLWFPVGQRTFSTAIGIFAFFFGYLITFLTTPWLYSISIFENDSNSTTMTLAKSEKFLFLNSPSLILSIVLLFLTYLIHYSTPKKPPAASAGHQIFKYQKKSILKSKFTGQIFIFGLAFGAVKFLTISYNDYLCLYGYELSFEAYYALLILIGGLAGVFLFSVVVDHFQEYKRTFRSCFALMAAAACLLGYAANNSDAAESVLISLGMFGVFGMATIFVGVEMGVETVYPMNQAIVGGVFFTSGYLCHLIFIGIKHAGIPCLVGLILIIGAILMLVCLQVKTRRKDYDTNAKLMRISVFSMENPSFTGKLSPTYEF